jgi:hypothetical protein
MKAEGGFLSDKWFFRRDTESKPASVIVLGWTTVAFWLYWFSDW